MSKLLKKDLLREDNSYQISQLGAFISAYNADQAFGIDNKRWLTLSSEGSNPAGVVEVGVTYRNNSNTNFSLTFGIPLPLIKNGKNLIITDTKIGLDDADASNYVDQYRLFRWTDFTSLAAVVTDGTNIDSVQEYTYGHADITLGGNGVRFLLLFECVVAGGQALDISEVQIEYYYG